MSLSGADEAPIFYMIRDKKFYLILYLDSGQIIGIYKGFKGKDENVEKIKDILHDEKDHAKHFMKEGDIDPDFIMSDLSMLNSLDLVKSDGAATFQNLLEIEKRELIMNELNKKLIKSKNCFKDEIAVKVSLLKKENNQYIEFSPVEKRVNIIIIPKSKELIKTFSLGQSASYRKLRSILLLENTKMFKYKETPREGHIEGNFSHYLESRIEQEFNDNFRKELEIIV